MKLIKLKGGPADGQVRLVDEMTIAVVIHDTFESMPADYTYAAVEGKAWQVKGINHT